MQICANCGEVNPGTYPLCGYCAARLTADSSREVRRDVTIVFSDLKDSTALAEKLDQESLVEVLASYFDEMRLILESHGGTIEKIIGDAIFAVFGLAGNGDDHALRGVRAAAESQHALAALNEQLNHHWGVRLVNRTGIATGTVVVASADAGEHLLIGDVVRLAQALEQSAPAMEVLVSEPTYRIVEDQVTVAPAAAVVGSGASAPVPAYRLVAVSSGDEGGVGSARTGEFAETKICLSCRVSNPIAFRRCGSCGAHLVAKRPRETRKTVTIVFADLKAITETIFELVVNIGAY